MADGEEGSSLSRTNRRLLLVGADQDRKLTERSTLLQRIWYGSFFEGWNAAGEEVYRPYIGGVAPSGAFGKLSPKDALKLAKTLKSLLRKGRAPKGIDRIDIPKLDGTTGLSIHSQQPHMHFNDGRALNFDGTWKHGGGEITTKIVKWIQENL